MCKARELDPLPQGFLDIEVFKRFLSELKSSNITVKHFKLFWLGEPLLHPKFKKILMLSAAQMPLVAFDTNGMLLDKSTSKALIEAGRRCPIHVKVSLDANSEETYSKIRLGGNFNKVRNNIKYLIRMRDEREYPKIMIQFIVQPLNAHEMLQFRDYWFGVFRAHGIKPAQLQDQHWAKQDGICFNHCDIQNGSSAEQKISLDFFRKEMEKLNSK